MPHSTQYRRAADYKTKPRTEKLQAIKTMYKMLRYKSWVPCSALQPDELKRVVDEQKRTFALL